MSGDSVCPKKIFPATDNASAPDSFIKRVMDNSPIEKQTGKCRKENNGWQNLKGKDGAKSIHVDQPTK